MQTLLAFLPVAQTAPNGNPVNAILEQLRQQTQVDPGTWALAFIIGQVVMIIGLLVASKAVVSAQYRDTLGNALKVWVMHWLVIILTVVVGLVLLLAFSAANLLQFVGIVLLVIALASLFLMIRIPMSVYNIGFFRAIGLLIIAWVVWLIGNVAASFVIGPPPAQQWALIQQIRQLTPEQRTELQEAIRKDRQGGFGGPSLPGEKEARDKSKPLQERAKALEAMYAELERRRQAVPPGDDAAKAAYERQKARYEAILDQLKAEAKAQGAGKTQ